MGSNEDIRKRAAVELKELVVITSRGISSEVKRLKPTNTWSRLSTGTLFRVLQYSERQDRPTYKPWQRSD
jgi:hypothetical protein